MSADCVTGAVGRAATDTRSAAGGLAKDLTARARGLMRGDGAGSAAANVFGVVVSILGAVARGNGGAVRSGAGEAAGGAMSSRGTGATLTAGVVGRAAGGGRGGGSGALAVTGGAARSLLGASELGARIQKALESAMAPTSAASAKRARRR